MSTTPLSLPQTHDARVDLVAKVAGVPHTLAASALAQTCGSLARLVHGARELGFDADAAERLSLAAELGRQVCTTPLSGAMPYGSSVAVARAYGPMLGGLAHERILVVGLDARQRPVCERVLAEGDAGSCLISVGVVCRWLIACGAAAALLVHNHPSGDPTPGVDDCEFTRLVIDACRAIEVPLVDHVIVTGAEGPSFSWLDAGLMPARGVQS